MEEFQDQVVGGQIRYNHDAFQAWRRAYRAGFSSTAGYTDPALCHIPYTTAPFFM